MITKSRLKCVFSLIYFFITGKSWTKSSKSSVEVDCVQQMVLFNVVMGTISFSYITFQLINI